MKCLYREKKQAKGAQHAANQTHSQTDRQTIVPVRHKHTEFYVMVFRGPSAGNMTPKILLSYRHHVREK